MFAGNFAEFFYNTNIHELTQMKIKELIEKLDLTVLSGPFEKEITGGYTSDLLSDVLANGKVGNMWITIQIHRNVVAVASLQNFAGVIFTRERKPDEQTVEEAKQAQLNLFSTSMSTYETAGKLYTLGV